MANQPPFFSANSSSLTAEPSKPKKLNGARRFARLPGGANKNLAQSAEIFVAIQVKVALGGFSKKFGNPVGIGLFCQFWVTHQVQIGSQLDWIPHSCGGGGACLQLPPRNPLSFRNSSFFFAHPSISFPFLGLLGTGFDDDVGFLCRNTNTQLRPPVCSTNVPSCPAKSAGHVLGAGHCDHWFTGGGEREGPTTPLRGEGVRPPPPARGPRQEPKFFFPCALCRKLMLLSCVFANLVKRNT